MLFLLLREVDQHCRQLFAVARMSPTYAAAYCHRLKKNGYRIVKRRKPPVW
jgi:hypothetical protein